MKAAAQIICCSVQLIKLGFYTLQRAVWSERSLTDIFHCNTMRIQRENTCFKLYFPFFRSGRLIRLPWGSRQCKAMQSNVRQMLGLLIYVWSWWPVSSDRTFFFKAAIYFLCSHEGKISWKMITLDILLLYEVLMAEVVANSKPIYTFSDINIHFDSFLTVSVQSSLSLSWFGLHQLLGKMSLWLLNLYHHTVYILELSK